MMTKAEKRRITQTAFTEQIQKNMLLKKYFVGAMKVQVYKDGKMKRNTRVGLIHYKLKQSDDVDDFGEPVSCFNQSTIN